MEKIYETVASVLKMTTDEVCKNCKKIEEMMLTTSRILNEVEAP